ncbi:lipopolysaccharide biosynthesis protein [Limosilactobacillus frumenti DSM 13145]|uniref:Capsular polysaccharide biosynthesis protein CpsC n=1 Tax=Limosilactobacillus frumenti DSM 13145 TaxID=1423746 RepID=A0A0R1P3K4_9LACO|nr:Wzz/FepE/Etk N-terminal domain-containing protein [Limosilactobacillus frumenti]KRL27200.1 lipopolysaccharide biosynthesis protein [Limosilactobacillus frumenti DSM 13145]
MNNNNSEATTNRDNQIDLHRLIVLCRSHIKLMIIWTLIVAVFGFVVAEFVIIPQYTASTQILVNQKHGNNSDQAYNNQQADIQMINTYKDIITNQVILKEASKQLDNPVEVITPARKAVYRENAAGRKELIRASRPAVVKQVRNKSYHVTTAQLKKAISVQTQQNSQVFSLNVKTNNPQKSAAVANTVSSVFKRKIKKIMSVNNVTIVSYASVPSSPSFPNKKLFTLAGALFGLLGSFAYILIKDLTDTTIKSDDFMTSELGLTNLGAVSHIHMDLVNERHSSKHSHRRV